MNLFYDNWLCYKNFTLTYYSNTVSSEDAEKLLALIPTGNMSAAVKGALDTAKATFESEQSIANYNALVDAIAAANASIADYAKLDAAIQSAQKYTVVDDDYSAFAVALEEAKSIYENGTDATCDGAIADLDQALKDAKVNDYQYVATKFGYAVALGTWTKSGDTGNMTGQHWSGDDGREYMEQSSAAWWQDSWTIGYNQDVTLPAGDYVFKAAGRKAAGDGCTLELVVKNKSTNTTLGTVNDFPEGDIGLGITVYGSTCFSADSIYANNNQGRGFQWRYVKFSLTEETTINVAVNAKATTSRQWVSFCDATVQTSNEANIAMIAYNIALKDAKAALDDDAYENVTGVEKTALETAIGADMAGKSKSEVEAATAALKEATAAFIAAAPAYDAYVATLQKVEGLDAAGKAKFEELEADLEGLDATTISASVIESVPASYIEAVKSQTTSGADMTDIIENAAIASTDGWSNARVNSGEKYSTAPDDTYFDVYNETRNMTQVIGTLNEGYYTLKCATRASAGMSDKTGNIYVQQDGKNLASTDINADGNQNGELGNGWSWTEVTFAVVESTKDITIGFYAECNNNQWAGADNFTLTYLGKAAIVTIGNSGLVTFSSTTEYVVPEGVEAYYATECNGTSVEMTMIENGQIPANTGVVLKAEADTYTLTPVIGAKSISGNLLVANPSEELKLAPTADGNTNYVLSNGEFHPFTGLATVAAGKAYLSVPEAVGANALQLSFGVADGIESIESNVADDVMFNLAGQAVGNDFKGIVIKNGKKLLKK